MNVLESMFCYHYRETVNDYGRYAGQRGGIVVVMVTIIMLIFSLLLLALAIIPGCEEAINRFITSIFGYGAGKTFGKLSAALLMLAIYPIVKYTIGSKESYDRIIDRFTELPEDEQKIVAKKGVTVFLGSIGLFFLMFALYGIVS